MPSRILVVEDGAIIAYDIAQILEMADFEVVGPASNVSQALDLLSRHGCDAAILDINLNNETAEPVALALNARRLPFLTLTGASEIDQAPIFRAAPSLTKPVSSARLVSELHRCLGTA